jgi:hypothetical protein
MRIVGKGKVVHSTSVCNVLACIGDRLDAIANRVCAVVVTFHGSFSQSDIAGYTL